MKLIMIQKIKQNNIVAEFENINQNIGKFHLGISNWTSDISKIYEKIENLYSIKVDVQGMNEVTEGYNSEF